MSENAVSIGASRRVQKNPAVWGSGLFGTAALLIAALAFSAPSLAAASRTAGLFVLRNVDSPLNPVTLHRPYISGLALQIGWRHVEPREGQYDWSKIDEALDVARAAGKRVTIHLLPHRPPEWVAQSGVPTYAKQILNRSDPRHGRAGVEVSIYWDPTFLQKWGNLTKQFGARYSPNPTLFGLGVTAFGEMQIPGSFPPNTETARMLKQLYRRDAYADAWRKMIDIYQEAFPDKAKFVVPGVVFDDAYFADDVMSYAHSRFGDKLWAFNTGLRAVFPTRNPKMAHIYSLLSEYAKRAHLGFQMIWSQSGDRADQLQGSLRESLTNGIQYGAGYIEVYHADVMNPSLQDDLQYAAGMLGNAAAGPRAPR